jgi:hypothetical protein
MSTAPASFPRIVEHHHAHQCFCDMSGQVPIASVKYFRHRTHIAAFSDVGLLNYEPIRAAGSSMDKKLSNMDFLLPFWAESWGMNNASVICAAGELIGYHDGR